MKKNKTLYIIGNGFDLAHDLNTSFADYKNFLNGTSPTYNYIKKKHFDDPHSNKNNIDTYFSGNPYFVQIRPIDIQFYHFLHQGNKILIHGYCNNIMGCFAGKIGYFKNQSCTNKKRLLSNTNLKYKKRNLFPTEGNYYNVVKTVQSFPYNNFDTEQNSWNNFEKSISLDWKKIKKDIDEGKLKKANNFTKDACQKISVDGLINWVNSISYKKENTERKTRGAFTKKESLLNNNNNFLKNNKNIHLESNNLYLSFNYTEFLEEFYHIPEENIFHIHGQHKNVNYIIGGKTNDFEVKILENEITEYSDLSQIRDYCSFTNKKTNEQLDDLEKFLKMHNIERVIEVGHTLNGVDEEYYSKIIVPILKQAEWTLYYHIKEEDNPLKKTDCSDLYDKIFFNKKYLDKKATLIRLK